MQLGSSTMCIHVAPDVTESQVSLFIGSAVGHFDIVVQVNALPVKQVFVAMWASPVLILGYFVPL
jgi:hypothetical protein